MADTIDARRTDRDPACQHFYPRFLSHHSVTSQSFWFVIRMVGVAEPDSLMLWFVPNAAQGVSL
jgi:hypothetical protein